MMLRAALKDTHYIGLHFDILYYSGVLALLTN